VNWPMKNVKLRIGAVCFLGITLFSTLRVRAQEQKIDVQKSNLTVHVYKTGLFSAFAHDHDIFAPIARGTAEISGHASVNLEVDARTLRVMDPGISDKDRAEIQTNMLGAEVLDSERFHEIIFQSTSAEPNGAEHWIVHGNLTVHGQTQPVTVEASRQAGHFTGQVTIKQTSFGIKPIRIAGGAVKVKDDVVIEFDVQLAQ